VLECLDEALSLENGLLVDAGDLPLGVIDHAVAVQVCSLEDPVDLLVQICVGEVAVHHLKASLQLSLRNEAVLVLVEGLE
jgi:hypothetical protein